MHGELFGIDRVIVQPAQQGLQRLHPAVAGNPQGQVVVIQRGAGQEPRRRAELEAAARVLAGATRDEENLTLRVPGDGGVTALRALLNQLDAHSINAEELSVHTPDLDDVFLALTGHANTEVNAQ